MRFAEPAEAGEEGVVVGRAVRGRCPSCCRSVNLRVDDLDVMVAAHIAVCIGRDGAVLVIVAVEVGNGGGHCQTYLADPENRREILADDKLSKVFGKAKVTMFEMNKHLAEHLT